MRFAKQIEDYWDATEEFSRDDQNQAGFIASVGTGPVKGGKTSWSAKQLWKGVVARRAREKMHKGLGFQLERGEQRKFGGYCNWCWRIGHKEAQCWF